MMLTIDRKYYDDCTVSRVTYGDFQCFMLELPWLDNQQDVSCIPEGVHTIFKRMSPSRKIEVMEYRDIPNRSNVQIHPGNYTRQILGCQLPGDGVKWLDDDGIPDVTRSGDTFDALMELLPDECSVLIKS